MQSSGQKVEFGETRRITLARPNQLRVEEIASDGRLDLALFDGKNITVFDGDSNVYASTPQPGTVDDALVFFVRDLRMRMPLARLLSSRLPSEWPKRVTTVDYVESFDIDGVKTHHVAGRTDAVDFQYWITDGPRPLPLRVVLTYVNEPGQPQFWANFSDWNTSPAAGKVDIRIHAVGGREADWLRGPGVGIRRCPATNVDQQGDQAMSRHSLAGASTCCAIALSALLALPAGDAWGARPERGGGGGGGYLEAGPRRERKHVATQQRPRRWSCCAGIGWRPGRTGVDTEQIGAGPGQPQ